MDSRRTGHGEGRRGEASAPHYDGIDGLRAVAVALVVVYHCGVPHLLGGFLGVDVFFAISGFVITLTLAREYDARGAIDRRSFYWRRFFRLMPALVAMVLFAAITELSTGRISAVGFLGAAAKALTYTQNLFQAANDHTGLELSHTWSLGVEEQFYLLWAPTLALILIGAGTRRRVSRTLALGVGFGLSGVLSTVALGATAAFFLPWARFDELLVGAALALAVHRHPDTRLTRTLAHPGTGGLVAGLLCLVVLDHPERHAAVLGDGGYLVVAALSAALIGHLYVRDRPARGPVAGLLTLAPLVWLGRRSYGIYLYHIPILLPYELLAGVHWIPALAVTAPLSVIAAAISYRYLERPVMARGHAWLRRGAEPTASSAGLGHAA